MSGSLTVLESEPENGDEENRIDDGNTKRNEEVEGPPGHSCELRGDQRCDKGPGS